ncbi:hypothetical protein DEJ50_20375 [Streptomyces venezuelae]|uniref:Uncharacterized protein n=1 Tax=Streptomyces venezuelae TaxID=54571 RepID=A0A5P2D3U8_STRVZ|nr:hypothetical protein [Streptomyces venezuelae]QES49825.1 hypothetical protein DEJ50_20375 [Streptomyces venezuelae]
MTETASQNQPDSVEMSLSDAIVAARDLNEYVVSLDRILSRIGTGGQDPEILVRYIVDRDVRTRLAEMRNVICTALESRLGEERVDEICEEAYFYTD